MKNAITTLLKKKIIILDGATGTQLQRHGMPSGACPERWCLQNPQVICEVHADYFAAGADIVYTCTFGANRIKLAQYDINDVFTCNKELALLARKAAGKSRLVAGDIGPTGKFVAPFGSLDFEEAVNIFKEQVKGLLAGGVDLFVIETMMDIQEARAALIAVKELTQAFTMVTMTFEKGGRTLNGNTAESALITLQSLGVDAFGCNCSTGPADMLKIISKIKPIATVPLVAKPNAGVPALINDKTVFTMKASTFATLSRKLIRAGANIIGGCCGTTPEHIRAQSAAAATMHPITLRRRSISAISSARAAVVLTPGKTFTIVGEKINPTGKKTLQKELLEGNFTLVRQLAREQEAAGAKILDVNVGIAGIDETKTMQEAIAILSIASDLPLAIDSSNPKAIERALRFYPGRALINSISAEPTRLTKLLPLAKKYGAMCILLPIATREIPATSFKRKKIIQTLLRKVTAEGLHREDCIIDALAMTVSCNGVAALATLETIGWCSRVLKCNTIVGLSNVSFGLPARHVINKVFLTLAKKRGLTLAIADPHDNVSTRNRLAHNLLLNKDKEGRTFISRYSLQYPLKKVSRTKIFPIGQQVFEAILEGNREAIKKLVEEALGAKIPAFKLMRDFMIPAIIKVGTFFETKKYFLPQLIASAETMKLAITQLEPFLENAHARNVKGIILLATVEGDIHDIGKNIVALLLKNYGFEIVDLGKDVSAQEIIAAVKKHSPDIVGLSALMTTTMVNMKDIVALAHQEGLPCKFMVGGAVVNKSYADSIGAIYAKDGVAAVKVAQSLVKKSL
jgi:5-methyltetrahydrofolate--homocysteine methyltransferase